MGLRIKRFKAKLNWKTKETVPEVVCLSYHTHSEFQTPIDPPPTTYNTTNNGIETTEVIKTKNKISRPTIQNLFETVPTTSIIQNKDNISIQTNNSGRTDKHSSNSQISLPEPPLKGILKKSVSVEENEIKDIKNQNTVLEKQSLLYATTKEEYNEDSNSETKHVKGLKDNKENLNVKKEKIIKNKNDSITIDNDEVTFRNTINDNKIEVSNKENVDSEEDNKAVHWRETVIEIKSNLQFETLSNEGNNNNNHSEHHKNKEYEYSETENNSANNGDKTQAPMEFFAGVYSEPAYIPKYLKKRENNTGSTKF